MKYKRRMKNVKCKLKIAKTHSKRELKDIGIQRRKYNKGKVKKSKCRRMKKQTRKNIEVEIEKEEKQR